MEKITNGPIKKHHDSHYVEARTAHQPEMEMEVASEFFSDDFVRPLDNQSILADQLIEKLKNDSQN